MFECVLFTDVIFETCSCNNCYSKGVVAGVATALAVGLIVVVISVLLNVILSVRLKKKTRE